MPRFKLSYATGILVFIFFTIIIYQQPNTYPLASKRLMTPSVTTAYQKKNENMAERLEHVRKICNSYRIMPNVTDSSLFFLKHPPAPQYSVFYFNTKKNQAFCPVYKSASTSMLHWMLSMHNVNAARVIKEKKRQISDVAREYFPSLDYPLAQEVLKTSVKWMVVRHPFERLLSAYRDKLEDSKAGREHGTLHFYEKYGKKIVSKYRKVPNDRLEPTFREFIDYIIDTNLLAYADDHWIPYYAFCTPCLVDYDVIIKFETFERDVKDLIKLLGSEEGPEVKHSNRGGRSHAELISSYYKQLDYTTILKLYDKFRLDFELFDYGIRDYLSDFKSPENV